MAFITPAYFILEINIPNTNQAAVSTRLSGFINKYEPKFLQKVLGYPLNEQFTTGYSNPSTADQKWKDLAEGKVYTKTDGKQTRWAGLINVANLESPIANYIYYWERRDAHTKTTTAGEQKNKVENSDNADPAQKIEKAWVEMLGMVCDLYDFLEANKDTYQPPNTRYQVLECELGNVNQYGI
jgi:hypothetical protein